MYLLKNKLENFQALQAYGVIQCLRRQEEVGRWFPKCSILSMFRVKIVYLEIGRCSKKDQKFVYVDIEWPAEL